MSDWVPQLKLSRQWLSYSLSFSAMLTIKLTVRRRPDKFDAFSRSQTILGRWNRFLRHW